MLTTLSASRVRLTAVLAAFAGFAGVSVAQPVFHLIGALPGSNTFSSGYGVSEDGSVVVGHSGNNYYYGSSSHAFKWTSDDGISDLDPLAPAAGAYGISADGTVIVGGETSGSVKAVRWAPGTSSLTDQLYHGGECYGLSRDGSTAIGYSASSGGGGTRPHRAIKYGQSGHLQFIDTAAPGTVDPTTSESLATNSDGSVVVGWGVFNGVQRAFRWTEAGNMVIITPGAGIANGVSGDGSIIVGEYTVGTARHAFRWTATTGLVDMGSLPGMARSVAYAISNDGSTIVGKTQATISGGAQHAFIWRADIGMQDLNLVLASVLPAGYTLTEARAINSNGTVIAGGSQTPSFGVEAWVVNTPTCIEPSVISSTGDTVTGLNGNVDLTVSAGGIGPFTYQWRKNSQDLSGQNGSHLVINTAGAADAGSYDCVITGPCGSATSSPATLRVCIADVNNDASVDLGDFFQFFNDFDQSLLGADVTSDGQVDLSDFFSFFSAFDASC